ncbi:MAG: hypothetical protein LBH44_00795, partial [Treponema sp.]|nr:hypothetical protein [Treponema sp.]
LNGFAVQRLTFSQGLPALSQAMEFPNMKLRPPNIRSASIVPITWHNAAFSSSPLPYAGYLSIAGYLPNISGRHQCSLTRQKRRLMSEHLNKWSNASFQKLLLFNSPCQALFEKYFLFFLK